MTTRAKFGFVVKGYADGTPWIAFEPMERQLRGEGLPSGIFGFDLPKGATGKRAEEIANFLNDNISQFTFTAMPLE
ncbi:MAG: hypothetical protein A2061_09840 [Gallionellales bacterium GWA2_59_43]|nr:MAG: hypothetical protein A2061_09840 [Gallionellales bacterium GWA2_59_43]